MAENSSTAVAPCESQSPFHFQLFFPPSTASKADITYETGHDDGCMVALERRYVQGDLGDNEDTAESADESPKGDHQVADSLRGLVPSISEKVGDRTRQPAPWRSGQIGIEIGIEVEVPAGQIEAFRPGRCVVRGLMHHLPSCVTNFQASQVPLPTLLVHEQCHQDDNLIGKSKTRSRLWHISPTNDINDRETKIGRHS